MPLANLMCTHAAKQLKHIPGRIVCLLNAGLLANLTCVQAELYEMEAAMSVGVDPLWVVPYTTVADSYQELLDDFSASVEVLCWQSHRRLPCMALLLSSNQFLIYICCAVCVSTAYGSWSALQPSTDQLVLTVSIWGQQQA